jgi:galactose mutarotase-like enzyme
VHPRHVNLLDFGGLGWLNGFDEWICRCGLTSNGPPCTDPVTGQFLTLHGRIANLPAHYLEVQVNLDEPYELRVIGQVDESTMFFNRLRLTSTLTTTPGSSKLLIEDDIENMSSKPAEVELLYHCNFGPPFVEEGSQVVAPIRKVAPRDDAAAAGIDTLSTIGAPAAGFKEQVFYYDLLPDRKDWTLALLHNATADRGVAIRMARSQLPHFIVWKNTAATEDGYVVGLEPATNLPNPKPVERRQGRVITLEPGEHYRATLVVEILDTGMTVQSVLDEIAAIQGPHQPLIYASPRSEST